MMDNAILKATGGVTTAGASMITIGTTTTTAITTAIMIANRAP
jgi:hypothetical protein